jgi:hypothetical protein
MSVSFKPVPCVICGAICESLLDGDGNVRWNIGEEAWPVADGRCCMQCYHDLVLPRRIYETEQPQKEVKKNE